MAPQVGLEPTTLRLTAECSAIELLRNKRPHIACESLTMCRARSAFYNKCIFKRQPRANQTARSQLALGNNLRQYLQPDSP